MSKTILGSITKYPDVGDFDKIIFNIENIITEFHFYFNDLRYIWISLVVRSRPIVFKT